MIDKSETNLQIIKNNSRIILLCLGGKNQWQMDSRTKKNSKKNSNEEL